MPIDWNRIDKKWQSEWERLRTFNADPDPNRPKCFVTFPFAYMSGPLHVGSGYTAARIDVYARYMRMRSYNVLYPWAWHWTGKTVAGAAERIKMGDENFIRPIREIDQVPEDHLKKFVDPVYMAKYYTDVNRDAIKKLGMSLDWRREFHTSSLDPAFNKFVEWQYLRLKERGYVAKGTHPVVWCPKDESPTGDADRLEGEGVRPENFTLVKFNHEGIILPCATLRPETIYGVTNLWVNPYEEYVEAVVDGEKWIISRQAAVKLGNQLKQVNVLRKLKGADLVGKHCTDPILNRKLIILPGKFVKTENATGLVYSVPAHAPYDWLALRDLQRDSTTLNEFHITLQEIETVQPISVISVNGYGDYPAIEIVNRMQINDQNDPLAEDATKEIYKAEFHSGFLKDNCGPYAKMKISQVKDTLVSDLHKKRIADVIYELPQRVVCRCTTECIAKILEDQWFLKYSDPAWKARTHTATTNMEFYPETARSWFTTVIDWLQDWPCARRTGLGTPLPWSPNWIVETLSDSTVYMAYYMVSKYVNSKIIAPEQLEPEVFDYLFSGIGDIKQLESKFKIDQKTLQQIRQEFTYWYPVDLRNSGKDLVGNHLTFFIFHHVALFEQKYWPRAIGVNGFMLAEGKPMHKSQGNFVPLWKACADFGADAVRCTILLAAEGMDDPDWRRENARDMQIRLESFLRLVDEKAQQTQIGKNGHLEKWIVDRVQTKSNLISNSIQKLKTRTSLATAIYDVWNDLRWYERRATIPDSNVIKKVLSIWIRLLAPFAPHLAEESWKILGESGLVTTAQWPEFDESSIDLRADELEELVKQILNDTQEIVTTTKMAPKKIHYYASAKWKWRVLTEALHRADTTPETLDGLIKDMITAKIGTQKDLPKYASKIVKQARTMPTDLRKRRIAVGDLNECDALIQAQTFLERELKAQIEVHNEDDQKLYDPKTRAKLAEPYRPAIYIE